GLLWGLDNHVYFAAGRNPKDLKHRGKSMVSVGSGDLRFDPRNETFEPVTGGLQFGHSIDDWGVRFVCSNSNHIQQVVYPQGYLDRNPYFVSSNAIRSIASDGASGVVYRTSPPEPWRIVRQKWRAAEKGYRLVINDKGGWEFIPLDPSKKAGAVPTEYPVGFFTSATGVTIYRGDAYPEAYRGNAFVGDVGGNLVHRKTLDTDHVVYRADRADEGEEFVTSSDNWFRPVNFVNAPDGTLYILDMYRETIEHPYSIPEEIKKFLHLSSGDDRGRIYRLVSPGMKRRPTVKLGGMSAPELVQQLESANGWNRMTAQRLLWERQDAAAVAPLRSLLASSASPLARLHSLYTLSGLNALTVEDVVKGLQDSHPRVREHAIRLSEAFLRPAGVQKVGSDVSLSLLSTLMSLAEDPSEHVRFQLAFTLGEADATQPKFREAIVTGLAKLAKTPQTPEVRTALMSSTAEVAGTLATQLLADKQFLAASHSPGVLGELMLVLGANPSPTGALEVLGAVAHLDLPLATQQQLLTGLGTGAARRGSSLRALLSGGADRQLAEAVGKLFQRAEEVAEDDEQPLAEREAAVTMLAFADVEQASASLRELLTPQSPQSLQLAAARSLAKLPGDELSRELLAGWRNYGPQVRREVVEGMLGRAGRVALLLDAVAAGDVKRGDLERDSKQRLLTHPDPAIKARALKLFEGETNSDRAKVVAAHQPALKLAADASRGLEVFKKKCAVCHQVGEIGHRVAPDLASVKNKSEADLLIAILDPNREAQPNFNVYSIQTEDGETFSGMI
ncbi:MAG: c-type cytochrome, partial [Planctomycetales bacterium]|nr:c-type cytochrome [Planctomycetales bacterium]